MPHTCYTFSFYAMTLETILFIVSDDGRMSGAVCVRRVFNDVTNL